MSRSRKKVAVCYNAGGDSQKRGKQACNRKFRRREHLLVTLGRTDEAPRRTWEITPSWNLGCEGHQWCGDASPELQAQVVRK